MREDGVGQEGELVQGTVRPIYFCAFAASLILASAPVSADLSPGADLVIDAVEVTQSVQDLVNSVTLIQDKNTNVRMHVRLTGALSVDGVGARLIGTRLAGPGAPLVLGAISPFNPPDGRITVTDTPDRAVRDDAFLFQLPPSWRLGTVQIIAQIDFADEFSEINEANNALVEIVTFVAASPMRVRIVDVDYPGGAPPTDLDNLRLISWLLRAYPVPTTMAQISLRNYPTTTFWPNRTCNCPPNGNGGCASTGTCDNNGAVGCGQDRDCGCGRINTELLLMRAFDKLNGQQGDDDGFAYHEDTRYYGFVNEVPGGFVRGCSYKGDQRAATGPTGPKTWNWDFDGSYGDWYGGHELGHAFGRGHAECCGAVDGDPFPYAGCTIGPPGGDVWGFDASLIEMYPPTYTDNMSYCDFQWVSDFTYEGLRQQMLDEKNASLPGPLPSAIQYVLVSGRVNFDLDTVLLGSVWSFSSQQPALTSTPGDYSIRFFDAAGGTLLTHSFTPLEDLGDEELSPPGTPALPGIPDRTGTIMESIPLPLGTARLAVFRLGTELASRFVSLNPPTVNLTAPNGGETLGGLVTATWTASDLDGGPLLSTLLYSDDGGTSWSTVLVDLPGSSASFDLSGFGGGTQGLLRVLVSDGFHTAEDTSDGFVTVPNRAPLVVVLSPEDPAQMHEGQALVFDAYVLDPEDGPLPATSITWSSSSDGVLGAGPSLAVSSLSPGAHIITVSAIDSGGATGQASISVSKTLPVPLLRGVPWLPPVALLLLAGALWLRRRRLGLIR